MVNKENWWLESRSGGANVNRMLGWPKTAEVALN